MKSRPTERVALIALVGAAAATIAYLGRGWNFLWDEWGMILFRRRGGVDAFLAPHNGHLEPVLVGIYRVLFATAGLSRYWPYRTVELGAHLAVGILFFVYVRRRLPAVATLALTSVVLFLGAAWEVLFWGMDLGYTLVMVVLLVMLLITDAPGLSARRRGLVLAALTIVALSTFGTGLAVVGGVFVEAALVRSRRRDLLWLAPPAVLFGLWFAFYRPGAHTPAALTAIPGAGRGGDLGSLGYTGIHPGPFLHTVWGLAESGAGGLVGQEVLSRYWLIGAMVIMGAGFVVNRRVTARWVALAATAGIFWASVALTPAVAGRVSLDSRYVYPSAILLLLLTVEAWMPSGASVQVVRGWRRHSVRPALIGAACLALAVPAMVLGVRDLNQYGSLARSGFASSERGLGAIQCPGANIPPSYEPQPSEPELTAGPYLAAVRDLGSPVPAAVLRSVCSHR